MGWNNQNLNEMSKSNCFRSYLVMSAAKRELLLCPFLPKSHRFLTLQKHSDTTKEKIEIGDSKVFRVSNCFFDFLRRNGLNWIRKYRYMLNTKNTAKSLLLGGLFRDIWPTVDTQFWCIDPKVLSISVVKLNNPNKKPKQEQKIDTKIPNAALELKHFTLWFFFLVIKNQSYHYSAFQHFWYETCGKNDCSGEQISL